MHIRTNLFSLIVIIVIVMSNVTYTSYFIIFLQTADVVSNFHIIIGKYKCDVSGEPILALIRV